MAKPKNQQITVAGFSTKYSGITNAILTPVGISEAFDPTKTDPFPSVKPFNAIWDTGATASVITGSVVSACGLKPIGMTKVLTASGEYETNVYLVNIELPNKVGIANRTVTEGKLSGGVDVLIGMDVISIGDLCITNVNGNTTFSFQIPSTGIINMDEHHQRVAKGAQNPRSEPKVGRNDPCPCGSGKKYKKCCGR